MEEMKNLVGSLEELTKKFRDAVDGFMNPGDDGAFHGHFAFQGDEDHFPPVFEQATNEERPTRVSESLVEEEEQFPSVFEAMTEERPTRVNESHVEEEHFPSVFEVGESSTRLLDDDKEEDEEEEEEEMEDLNFEEEPVISKSYNKQHNKMPRHYQTRSTTRTGTGTRTSSEMEDLNRPRTTTNPVFEKATNEDRPTRVSESHAEEEQFPSVFEVGESSTRPLDDGEEDEEEEMEGLNTEEEPEVEPESMTNAWNAFQKQQRILQQKQKSRGRIDPAKVAKIWEGKSEDEKMKFAWNAFQKQQRILQQKQKSRGRIDPAKVAKIWEGKSKDEKMKFGKKEHKVKVSIRCVPKSFLDPLEKLGPERRKLLEDSPFHRLLVMERDIQDNERIKQLVSLFNTKEKCIEIEGVKYAVTPDDFTQIMGVEDGEEEIKMPGRGAKKKSPTEAQKKSPTQAQKKLLAQLRRDFINKGNNISMVNVVKQLSESIDEDNVKRAYALLALRHIICAPSSGDLNGSFFLDIVQDVSGLNKKKWATFAIEKLVEGIKTYKTGKGNTERYLGGCAIFLQLFVKKLTSITVPKRNVPFECDDKRQKKKRRKDCSDSLKSVESRCLEAKETLQQLKESLMVKIQKWRKENNSNYKKDPFKKYISDAFSSSVESLIEAIITIFEKRLDEQVEGVAARKR